MVRCILSTISTVAAPGVHATDASSTSSSVANFAKASSNLSWRVAGTWSPLPIANLFSSPTATFMLMCVGSSSTVSIAVSSRPAVPVLDIDAEEAEADPRLGESPCV